MKNVKEENMPRVTAEDRKVAARTEVDLEFRKEMGGVLTPLGAWALRIRQQRINIATAINISACIFFPEVEDPRRDVLLSVVYIDDSAHAPKDTCEA